MKRKTDEAFGVIPIHRDGNNIKVLVVNQISYRKDSFWILPKGHAELDETGEEAALRELEEETGLVDVILDVLSPFTIDYSFVDNGVRINKTVTYYLGYTNDTDTRISQPQEIKELRWCAPEEAQELLTHQNSKDLLKKALEYIAEK